MKIKGYIFIGDKLGLDLTKCARVTIPLFNVDFRTKGRLELSEGVVLAELIAREAERVRAYHAYEHDKLPAPLFRLEIFVNADRSSEISEGSVRAQQIINLLTCASNAIPQWFSIPIDRYSADNKHWERSSLASIDSNRPHDLSMWNKPEEISSFFGFSTWSNAKLWFVEQVAIDRWSALLNNWPLPGSQKRLDIALDYLAQAIADLLVHERRALLSTSIAFEALFGTRTSEIRHRTAQRMAHLLLKGRNAFHLYEQARRWYDGRSKLVHAGVVPEPSLTTEFISYLRAALPAMLRLIKVAGTHDRALELLDRACFDEPLELKEMRGDPDDCWWRLPLESINGSTTLSC